MGMLVRPELYICGVYLAIIVGLLWFQRSTAARIIAHAIEQRQASPTTPTAPGASAPPSTPTPRSE
jgi:hypothetical protein